MGRAAGIDGARAGADRAAGRYQPGMPQGRQPVGIGAADRLGIGQGGGGIGRAVAGDPGIGGQPAQRIE